jgi:1,2-dihydroxy-3-keto-5-methylthiopentene dioxygenase
MSRLRIYPDTDPNTVLLETRNPEFIARELHSIGVKFSRWHSAVPLSEFDPNVPGVDPSAVLQAFDGDIKALMASGGYQSVDVVSLFPNHPDRATLRQKFLNEHTHAEDEIRFFVAGGGLFTIHHSAKVFEVECVRNDLINLPAGTQHWFDMGEQPFFVAIRIFTNPAGWVANFTGSDIAQQFPRYVA